MGARIMIINLCVIILFTILASVALGLASDMPCVKDQLCSFEAKPTDKTQGACGGGMEAEIKEIKREPQVSIVHVKVKKRGTYAGSIMYQVCCFSRIAKALGYRYYVSLGEKDLEECKDCEWNKEHILGFLSSKTDSIGLAFKGRYDRSKKYEVQDINEASMVCGYLPIPSSKFLKAVYFGNLAKIKELLEKNRNLISTKENEGFQALHIATVEGHSDVIRYLVGTNADINGKGKWGWTPLHLAVIFDRPQIAQLLLSLKADPATKMDWGNTPLHEAGYQGSVEMAELFLGAGISVEIEDNEGNTPLHAAASRNRLEVVKLLIDKGANPKRQNKFGQTALLFAETLKHKETVEFLERYR